MLDYFETIVPALSLEIDANLVRDYVESKSDRAANEIVRTYRKFVYATALRYVEDYDDADDVAQEVFIKALDSLSKFKGNSSLKTWIYRITVNMAINYKRKRKFISFFSLSSEESVFEIASSDHTPDLNLEGKEFESLFLKSLSKLPEKQRETFALRYFDEMPYEEISKMLGTSVGGLKANYHQAVKKLAVLIKNEPERI